MTYKTTLTYKSGESKTVGFYSEVAKNNFKGPAFISALCEAHKTGTSFDAGFGVYSFEENKTVVDDYNFELMSTEKFYDIQLNAK